MKPPSPTRNATLRALHGEPEPHVIIEAPSDSRSALILALAPGADPVFGAPGALAVQLPVLLSPDLRDSPAIHAAIASLIGTDVHHSSARAEARDRARSGEAAQANLVLHDRQMTDG